jgi:hypothetical protein
VRQTAEDQEKRKELAIMTQEDGSIEKTSRDVGANQSQDSEPSASNAAKQQSASTAASSTVGQDVTSSHERDLKKQTETLVAWLIKSDIQQESWPNLFTETQKLTMFSLVEEVVVNERLCKLLYLTNQEATNLNASFKLETFILAMGINPRPQFVINLMPSVVGRSQGRTLEKAWNNFDEMKEPWHMSELGGRAGLDALERRIALFLRQVVLPTAIQTNAVVFTNKHDVCILSTIFGKLCEAEAAKNGNKLPFTVIHIGSAEAYLKTSWDDKKTVAGQLRSGSRRWKSHELAVAQTVSEKYKHESGWSSAKGDAPLGSTHYIVLDK